MNFFAYNRSFLLLYLANCVTAQLVIDLLEDNKLSSDGFQKDKTRRVLQPSFDVKHVENLLNLESIRIRHKKKQRSRVGHNRQDNVEEATIKYMQYGSRTGPSLYTKEHNIYNVTYWHGLAEEGFGFASFTKRGNHLAATFSTAQDIYSFSTIHDGSYIVHVMKWEDTATRDPLLQPRKYNKNATSTDKKEEDRRSLIRTTTFAATNTNGQKEVSFQFSLQQLKDRYLQTWHDKNNQRNLAPYVQIDILVIASQQATCVVAGQERSCINPNENPIKTKIEQNLDVLNTATAGVLVPYTFKMVGFKVSGFPEKDIVAAHEFSKSADYISKWANEVAADLIMIIVDPNDSIMEVDGVSREVGGIAEPGEAAQSNGYSAMNSAYLDAYQFSYNVGRNVGCRAQREYFTNSERLEPNIYNYAYEQYDDSKSYFRTIMGLQCQRHPFDCPIAPFFSARDFQIFFHDLQENVNLGGANNDNAKYIIEYGGKKTADRRTTPVSPDDDDDECFSSSNMVNVLGKGLINMDELKIGDYVQDVYNRDKKQQYHYTRVYSFAHLDHDVEGTYLQFHFEEQVPLEISSHHLVFVVPQGNNKQHLVRAEDVQVGDKLHTYDQRDITVQSIKKIQRRGVYAPITESGTFVVSGVLASSYVAIMGYSHCLQHALAHMLFSPLRLVCHFNFDFCVNETYKDGISERYWTVLQFFLYLRSNYNPKMQLAWTVIGAMVVILVYVTEQIIYDPMLGVKMAFLLMIIIAFLRHKKNAEMDEKSIAGR